MSNLSQYSKVSILVRGSLLTESGKVTLKRVSAAQVVKTISKGFAGMSPGAKFMTISVTNAVPSADFELDLGRSIELLSIEEITLFVAGRTLTTKGIFTEDNFSGATDTPSELSFEATAQYKNWI